MKWFSLRVGQGKKDSNGSEGVHAKMREPDVYMDEQLKLKRPQEGFLLKNNGSGYSEPKAS